MKVTVATIVAALLAGSSEAVYQKPPKPVKPNLVDGFVWKNPFQAENIASFEPSCEVTRKFDTLEFTLHDLLNPPPKGLKPWADGLKKVFSDREYPGGWSGYDRHGYDRAIVQMDYDKVPLAVRLWIEDQERTAGEGKGLYAVFEKPKDDEDKISAVVTFPGADQVNRTADESKVVIFAPGAIYHILPLWVAEGSSCQDELLDLSKYKPQPGNDNVVGWLEHGYREKKTADFTVTVKAMKEKAAPSASEGVSDGSRDEL